MFRKLILQSSSVEKVRFCSSMVHKKLEGKVAVVTASTEGIGYAIAKIFAESGAKVVVSSRKEDKVLAAVESLKKLDLHVSGIPCHVSKKQDRDKLINKTLEEHGKIDILVSNAGTNPVFGSLMDVSEDAWDKIFDVNLKSSFLLAKDFMPHIVKTKGCMLFNSSIAAYVPLPGLVAYSISKTALLGLVKGLAVESGPMNVRVNGIAPGIIKTNFSQALTTTESINKKLLANVPLHRYGTPDDCAKAALFLCSDDASYVTGEIMTVTGGMHSRL